MTDEAYIDLCLALAKKGRGAASPNPLVGCVVVKDGAIVGAGYHEKFGGPHAEINALDNAGDNARGAELFVNLEPCSHYGKTPPCADAIIEAGVKRVVVGVIDPNPLVSGKGVERLREAGIEVRTGVREERCKDLNRFFFKRVSEGVPYVTLKIAQTLDGKIADRDGGSKWITSATSRRKVHRLRSGYDAVLVGANTARADDPRLTVRMTEGRDPLRIVIDSRLRLRATLKCFTERGDRTVVLALNETKKKARKLATLRDLGVRVVHVRKARDGGVDLKDALKKIVGLGVNSLLVEGGAKIFTAFVAKELFDEIRIFAAPMFLGGGKSAIGDVGARSLREAKRLEVVEVERSGADVFIQMRKIDGG